MSLRGRPAPVAAQPFATKKRYGCGVPLAGAISCRNPRLRTSSLLMSLRGRPAPVAISCRNPRLRTSSLPMSLRDPNGVVAISCRNPRPHTNLFARTVCRLRGRRAGMPRPTTVERTLAVGGRRPRRPACRNPIMHKPILLFPAHKSVISKFKIRRKLFTIHFSLKILPSDRFRSKGRFFV